MYTLDESPYFFYLFMCKSLIVWYELLSIDEGWLRGCWWEMGRKSLKVLTVEV